MPKRAELQPLERAVSDTLDEYLSRLHGIMSSWAFPDEFLEFLKDRGYGVFPVSELAVDEVDIGNRVIKNLSTGEHSWTDSCGVIYAFDEVTGWKPAIPQIDNGAGGGGTQPRPQNARATIPAPVAARGGTMLSERMRQWTKNNPDPDSNIMVLIFAEEVTVLESRIAELEAELQEHDDYYRKVVNGECAPDEVHCTCVPALRNKIDSLEAEVTSFRCGLRGHT